MNQQGLSGNKFLIVDDSPYMRKVMASTLMSFGAVVAHKASSTLQALRILNKTMVDLIIVDWEMEPVNGLVLAHYLRAAPKSPAPFTPILMTAAFVDWSCVFAASCAGANGFLIRPFSRQKLYDHALQLVRSPAAADRQAAS